MKMIKNQQDNFETRNQNTSLPYPWSKVFLVFAGLVVVGFIAVSPPPGLSSESVTAYKIVFGGMMGLLFGLGYAIYKYFRR